MKTVIILVGASGSGKSSWVKEYLRLGGSPLVVSADHYFEGADGSYVFDRTKLHKAHRQCQSRFQQAVDSGVDTIIVDNTNTRGWERKLYVEAGQKAGYKVWLKVFKVNPHVAATRNVHDVPLDVIKNMNDRIDVEEGFYEISKP